ncbi:MAG: MBL fold metallo-hydrolase [Bryobacteraceae bacterium]|jgi:metallo-beta-lactamase class B
MSKILAAFLLPCFLQAQANTVSDAQRHFDEAQRIAGTQWAAAARYFCSSEEQVAPTLPSVTAKDIEGQYVEPTRLFDNLYFIGTKGIATFAITSAEGIILIDSGYPDQVEPTLIAGMKKLGLNPADVKYVIVTHGHVDHYGGSWYLQEHFGAHVALSAIDWDLIEPKPGAKNGGPLPRRDIVAAEGKPITLGDVQVIPVLIPGHTPGSLGLIFPVKDAGALHMAGLFGGTILSAGNKVPVATFQEYVRSIGHFAEISRKWKVDVELQNHPLMDGTFTKLAALRTRRPGDPNPFVVGEVAFGNYLNVMSECMQAHIALRAGK